MKTLFLLRAGKHTGKPEIFIFSIVLLGFVVSACSPSPDLKSLAGYIVIEENTIYLDEVEVITAEDEDSIAELDLKDRDMPNGYYIHNLNRETVSFELTDETEFTFTDYHLLFVEEPDSDRMYTTTKKEDYSQHLKTSSNIPFTGEVAYPLFIKVKDDKVISITEKFILTQ